MCVIIRLCVLTVGVVLWRLGASVCRLVTARTDNVLLQGVGCVGVTVIDGGVCVLLL